LFGYYAIVWNKAFVTTAKHHLFKLSQPQLKLRYFKLTSFVQAFVINWYGSGLQHYFQGKEKRQAGNHR
jgi:hypothetical protein